MWQARVVSMVHDGACSLVVQLLHSNTVLRLAVRTSAAQRPRTAAQNTNRFLERRFRCADRLSWY
jgi:hypothetical protein